MARPLRICYEGAVYHVTVRGNERRAIFLSNERYLIFLSNEDIWGRYLPISRDIWAILSGDAIPIILLYFRRHSIIMKLWHV
jgi:hypothetical protein